MSANPTPTIPPSSRRRRRLAVLAAIVGVVLVAGIVSRCGGSAQVPADDVASGGGRQQGAGDVGTSGTMPSEASGLPARFADAALAALAADTEAQVAAAPGDATATTDPTGPGAPDGGAAPGGDTAGDGDGAAVPIGPPVLSVDPTLTLAPGETEGTIWLRNVGGSPLTWSLDEAEGPPLVSPAGGIIAPGEQAMTAFEWYLPQLQSDVDITVTFLSDGGTVEVAVHLTALEPVFSIVDGTWNIRNGNTFLVDYGVMDLGLTLRNDGTAPLAVDPQEVAGLDVIGGPWVLAPGQEVHLHVVLCNAHYSGGIPDFHDRDLHVHTDGWQGTLDFGVRFTLAPGQVAPAC